MTSANTARNRRSAQLSGPRGVNYVRRTQDAVYYLCAWHVRRRPVYCCAHGFHQGLQVSLVLRDHRGVLVLRGVPRMYTGVQSQVNHEYFGVPRGTVPQTGFSEEPLVVVFVGKVLPADSNITQLTKPGRRVRICCSKPLHNSSMHRARQQSDTTALQSTLNCWSLTSRRRFCLPVRTLISCRSLRCSRTCHPSLSISISTPT
jgi:hypothetical protein